MRTLSRREFLKLTEQGVAVVGVAAVAGPAVAFFFPADLRETPAEPVSAGPATDVPVGSSKTVPYGRYPALVVNTPDGLRAYSAVCTHFACLVSWDAQRGEITCPCHDAAFDAGDGHVLSGPPPKPLVSIPVTVTNGEIWVGGEV